jgi:hypothetical protein
MLKNNAIDNNLIFFFFNILFSNAINMQTVCFYVINLKLSYHALLQNAFNPVGSLFVYKFVSS